MDDDMGKLKKPIFFILLIYLFLMLSGCGGGDSNDNDELSYASVSFFLDIPKEENTSLTINGINGRISLTEDTGISSIIISGVMKVGSTVSAEDAQQHLDQLDVENAIQGDVIIVKTAQPKKSNGRNYIVDYEILFPDDMQINVSNVNGEISIQSTFSNFSLSQVNGSIEAEAALPQQGSFNLSTADGDITLYIPTDTSSLLSSITATGEISFSNLTINDLVHTDHSLSGYLGAGEGNIIISTANGNIAINGQ